VNAAVKRRPTAVSAVSSNALGRVSQFRARCGGLGVRAIGVERHALAGPAEGRAHDEAAWPGGDDELGSDYGRGEENRRRDEDPPRAAPAAVNAIGRILFIVFLLLGLLGSTGILGDTVAVIVVVVVLRRTGKLSPRTFRRVVGSLTPAATANRAPHPQLQQPPGLTIRP